MREILFRGKRIDNGEWIYGHLYITHSGEYEIGSYDKKLNIERLTSVVVPESVGQYTGLKDKNGKEIYEGDIVKGKDELEPNIEVYGFIDYMNGSFVIVGDFMTHYRWLDYSVEVIGNIYDNPELIRSDIK